MTPRIAALRDRIQLLAAVDRTRQVFGAATHGYELAAPLDVDGLAALEARFGVLPDDYLAFVRAIAARGPGPYHGLLAPEAPNDPHHAVPPDPRRAFGADDGSRLDGTVAIADQGCGGRSLLVIAGPHAGEVWSDWTAEQGALELEAPTFLAWYERWLDRALLEWIDREAPRIALDGPENGEELEAVAIAFDLVQKALGDRGDARLARTLGYLHLREERWVDAEALFSAASKVAGAEERDARLALDRARVALKSGELDEAIAAARFGLATSNVGHATRDELRDTLERTFLVAGRTADALAVLDQRAIECTFSLALHHRLAREHLARNDLANAGAALERASRMANVLGSPRSIEDRVPATFDPIVAELRAAGRGVDADALAARATLILEAN